MDVRGEDLRTIHPHLPAGHQLTSPPAGDSLDRAGMRWWLPYEYNVWARRDSLLAAVCLHPESAPSVAVPPSVPARRSRSPGTYVDRLAAACLVVQHELDKCILPSAPGAAADFDPRGGISDKSTPPWDAPWVFCGSQSSLGAGRVVNCSIAFVTIVTGCGQRAYVYYRHDGS